MATGNDCNCLYPDTFNLDLADGAKKKPEPRERILAGRRLVLDMMRQAYGEQGITDTQDARRAYIASWQARAGGRFIDEDVVLVAGSYGTIGHANGAAYWDSPGGRNTNVSTWSFAALYGLACAVGGAYETAVAGCGSSSVNSAFGAFTLDSIMQNHAGAVNALRYLADCMARGMQGGGGTPEY